MSRERERERERERGAHTYKCILHSISQLILNAISLLIKPIEIVNRLSTNFQLTTNT